MQDPTGTIVVPAVLYDGEPLQNSSCVLGVDLIYLEDNSRPTGRNCVSNFPSSWELIGQPAGEYRLDLFRYDNNQVLSTTTRTLGPNQTTEFSNIDLNAFGGLLAGELKINGEQPPDWRYSICPRVEAGTCKDDVSYVVHGRFSAFVLPGPGIFSARGPTDILLGTFTFTGTGAVHVNPTSTTPAPH